MNISKIAIGSDHAGFDYKTKIVRYLNERDIYVMDFGAYTEDSVDYPDHIHPVAEAIEKGEVELGIILCGSGNGAAMTANKHAGIRAGLCWTAELAQLTRQHNDANILAIPARFVSESQAMEMVEKFITTPFDGGRHLRRVEKIRCS